MSQSRKKPKKDDLNLSKLCDLVASNKLDEIKEIVKKAKIEKDWRWQFSHEYYIENAVRDAILLGQIETVQFFLDAGVSPDRHAYVKGEHYVSPFVSFAAESGNLAMVQLLVECGAEISPRNDYYDKGDDSGIRAAVEAGHVDIVAYLLEKGANAAGVIRGYRDTAFLAKAAENENIPMVELLLNYGASIKSALYLAYEKFYSDYRQYKDAKRDALKDSHYRMIKILLDYAMGIDLPSKKWTFATGEYDGLNFLKKIDISGFNFIGISIAGQPITPDMLIQRGFKGADKTLVSQNDLVNVTDNARREFLTNSLENHIRKKGLLISSLGIVNLVPLWRAAEIGDIAAVTTRLKAGIDPNDGIADGEIPLVLAAQNGYFDIVKILAEHPQIDKKTIVKAIEHARENKHEEIVAWLCDQQNINAVDEAGNTLLHKAVEKRDVAQVQTLIAKGADVNLQNENKETPLLIAAALPGKKATAIVAMLLQQGADANKYQWGSPLSCAVNSHNAESVALLLPCTEKRELIRRSIFNDKEVSRDPWYVDLIFSAVYKKNNIELLSLLKANGADFNAKSKCGETLLNEAIRASLTSFRDIVKTMDDLACDKYDRRLDGMINTQNYFELEAQERFKEAFKLIYFLLDNGADINFSDKEGNTPLHLLIKEADLSHIKEAYEQILGVYVQRGANVNAKNAQGFTPLHEAASCGDLIAIEFLLDQGGEINSTNIYQRTPLHQAVVHGNPKTTELLIKSGADVNALDEDGLTPLELCKKTHLQDKKGRKFSSWKAENEFDEPWLKTQRILSSVLYGNKSAMTELVRQRQNLYGTNSLDKNDLFAARQNQATTFKF